MCSALNFPWATTNVVVAASSAVVAMHGIFDFLMIHWKTNWGILITLSFKGGAMLPQCTLVGEKMWIMPQGMVRGQRKSWGGTGALWWSSTIMDSFRSPMCTHHQKTWAARAWCHSLGSCRTWRYRDSRQKREREREIACGSFPGLSGDARCGNVGGPTPRMICSLARTYLKRCRRNGRT